jgi:hypothetical protein
VTPGNTAALANCKYSVVNVTETYVLLLSSMSMCFVDSVRAQINLDKRFARPNTHRFHPTANVPAEGGCPMRISLIARAGIVATVVALAVGTVDAKVKGDDPGDVLTVGTFGNGTAEDLTVPDLGTLRAECSAIGSPSITLNGGAPFEIVRVFEAGGAGSNSGVTTYSSSGPDSFGSLGAELWLSNVQGQWRFEYYAVSGPFPCRAGAVITRIS